MSDTYQQENGWRDPPWEELIDGETVPVYPNPGVNHYFISGNIQQILREYLEKKDNTSVWAVRGHLGLFLTERDIFIPDNMVICDESKIQEDGVHGGPDLVVEILAAPTAGRDRNRARPASALPETQTAVSSVSQHRRRTPCEHRVFPFPLAKAPENGYNRPVVWSLTTMLSAFPLA